MSNDKLTSISRGGVIFGHMIREAVARYRAFAVSMDQPMTIDHARDGLMTNLAVCELVFAGGDANDVDRAAIHARLDAIMDESYATLRDGGVSRG